MLGRINGSGPETTTWTGKDAVVGDRIYDLDYMIPLNEYWIELISKLSTFCCLIIRVIVTAMEVYRHAWLDTTNWKCGTNYGWYTHNSRN